jgi:hypothetical protein
LNDIIDLANGGVAVFFKATEITTMTLVGSIVFTLMIYKENVDVASLIQVGESCAQVPLAFEGEDFLERTVAFQSDR